MESKDQRRTERLKQLAAERGGVKTLAEKAGLRWESLDQIIKGVPLPAKQDGTQNARSLGDSAAEALEDAYSLGRGWFDWPFEFVDHRKYWALKPEQRAIIQDRLMQEIERLKPSLPAPPPPPDTSGPQVLIVTSTKATPKKQRG